MPYVRFVVAFSGLEANITLFTRSVLTEIVPPPATATTMADLNPGDDKLVFESSEAVKVVTTFDQLGLKEDLLRGIYAYGERWQKACVPRSG